MFGNLRAIGKVVAIISGAAGAIAALWAIHSSSRSLSDLKQEAEQRAKRERHEQVLLWQQPIVFRLIVESGDKGISFGQLLEKYKLIGLANDGLEIPKDQLGENALRLVLVELMRDSIIHASKIDVYRVTSDDDDKKSVEGRLTNYIAPTLAFLAQPGRNGTKTIEQLALPLSDYLAKEVPDSDRPSTSDVQLLIGTIVRLGLVGVDAEDHVWNVLSMSAEQRRNIIAAQRNAEPAEPLTKASSETSRKGNDRRNKRDEGN
jgi:hypothetical protein